MAISLATNSTNDLYLDDQGNIATVVDVFAVEQDCDHAVKARLGEEMYQTDIGMPFFQTVFYQLKQQQFNAAGIFNIQRVPGVVMVTSFESKQSGSVLSYTALIESIYGEIFLNG